MGEYSYNNKRIAKNTLLLYFRMFLLMLISLYTSRVVLEALGVIDYGIYNVIAGFVAIFSTLNSSMSTALGRFLTIEIGKGNLDGLKTVFSTSIAIQTFFSMLVIILGETIGLWFLNNILDIPNDRMTAANWCYQLSLISFVVGLLSIPYNAIIFAHEKMTIFAYVSLIEAMGKLSIAFGITFCSCDKLILWGIMSAVLTCIIRWIYSWYCKLQFDEAKASMRFSKDVFFRIYGFAGWNYLGIVSTMIRIHGISLLMNVFFGPTINTARALAAKVESAMYQFVSNFSIAYNPQIIKLYARGDYQKMHLLICQSSKLSFFLFFIISLPVLFETETVLSLWLKEVPVFTSLFLKLTILFSLFRSLSHPLITAVNATGKIKWYQISLNSISYVLIFPMVYIFFRLGYSHYWAYIMCIIMEFMSLLIRMYWANKLTKLGIYAYVRFVFIRVLIVLIITLGLLHYISFVLQDLSLKSLIMIILTIATTSLTVLFCGLSRKERAFVLEMVTNQIKR